MLPFASNDGTAIRPVYWHGERVVAVARSRRAARDWAGRAGTQMERWWTATLATRRVTRRPERPRPGWDWPPAVPTAAVDLRVVRAGWRCWLVVAECVAPDNVPMVWQARRKAILWG